MSETVNNNSYRQLKDINKYSVDSNCMSLKEERTNYDLMIEKNVHTKLGLNNLNCKTNTKLKNWTRTGL